jgi:hypothetical protein
MQTFLPYPNFDHSVRVLDYRRLGKQRLECNQILSALRAESSMPVGWTNHPATKMWKGYEEALHVYCQMCVNEWIARGYHNTMSVWFDEDWQGYKGSWCNGVDARKVQVPPWLGDARFHASHRAALLWKDPGHYGQFGWTEEPELNYVWPTKELEACI